MRIEDVVPGRARKTRHGRRDHRAALRQAVEEGNPPRQAAKTCEKTDLRAAALGPHTAGMTVDVDGGGRGLAQWTLSPDRRLLLVALLIPQQRWPNQQKR